jgi:hypothetical protein
VARCAIRTSNVCMQIAADAGYRARPCVIGPTVPEWPFKDFVIQATAEDIRAVPWVWQRQSEARR